MPVVDIKNIILITIDCLRADHLGCYGYKRNTTPYIDKLALKGVLFSQAISNGVTAFSFPSIMASALPPLQMAEDRQIMRRSITLAEVLKEAGYHTAGFHSNPLLARFFHYGKGFDTFDDNLNKRGNLRRQTMRRRLGEKLRPLLKLIPGRSIHNLLVRLWALGGVADFFISGPPYLRAGNITNEAIKWQKEQEGRFFLWVHYMDCHKPYMPLPEYLSQLGVPPVSRRKMTSLVYKQRYKSDRLSPSEIDQLIDLYDAAIMSVDDAIGRLLDCLGSQLANTIIITTADHGEEFGEHGAFGHRTLYDGIIHVPLIIAGPGISSGTVVKQQVHLIDIAPTLIDLVGIGNVPSFQGRSLLPNIMGEEEIRDGVIITMANPWTKKIGYRTSGWKYIRTDCLSETGNVLIDETYDLENDPRETRNLHCSGSREASDFELQAKNKILQFQKRRIEEETTYEKRRIEAKIMKLKRQNL